MSKRRNRGFVMRPAEMLKSPAFRVMSLSGHRILAYAEIEYVAHHGKTEYLVLTHAQLRKYGMHDHAIAPALREVDALGFGQVKSGRAGNADHRRANKIRLTYLRCNDAEPTHEWRQILTVEDAEKIANIARNQRRKGYRTSRKSQWRKTQKPVAETASENPGFQWRKPPVKH